MMRIGKGNHWDECGYARRLDPEPVTGVPVPGLTPEIALWLSQSLTTVADQWAPRFRAQIVKSVLGILPMLARFVVVNYVLEDGCPFAAVSRSQLQNALGWGKAVSTMRCTPAPSPGSARVPRSSLTPAVMPVPAALSL